MFVTPGFFKRGKSSLINAIIGKPLAPVAVTPVTAIITLFEYDHKKSHAVIHFKDGSIVEKQSGEVSRYVNEDENPANEKQVRVVSIFDDAPVLRSVSLVDTPGIGSSFEHNTATTLQFIPKIDAALFLLSADMPVSRLDTDFLKELKETEPKIVFVMNKKDLLSESDLKKLMRHNTAAIAEVMELPVEKINCIAVSVREHEQGNEESGIRRLMGEIQSIATHEKPALLRQAALKRYTRLHRQLLMQVKLKSDSLLMPLHQLKEKQEKLDGSIALMKDQREEFEDIIRGKVRLLQNHIDAVINQESAMIKNEIFEEIDHRDNILQAEALSAIQQELNRLLIARFESVKTTLEQHTREQFRNLLQQYGARSQSFLNELATHLHSLLGISFDMIADRFDLKVYTSFYLSLDSGISVIRSHNYMLTKLLPASSRKKRLVNTLKEHYNNLIIRNSASIAYDLVYKIQESFRKFNYDLNNHLQELLESIREIIAYTIRQKDNAESEVEEEIEALRKKMRLMELIRVEDMPLN